MKNERILNNIGQVDEKYIMEAAPKKNKHKNSNLLTWVSMVACLCIVAGSIFAVSKMTQDPQSIVINEIGVPSNADMDVKIAHYISDGFLYDVAKEDWEQLMYKFKLFTGITFDDFKKMIPDNWQIEAFYTISAKANEENETKNEYFIHDFVLEYRTENNSTSRISFCPFESPLRDIVICNNPKQSEINGIPVTVYGFDSYYIAQFSYKNSNYDIETKYATLEELEALLTAIISAN